MKDKTQFQKLAELFGFKVNAEAIEEINTNEMDYPDDWDEMSEDEQDAYKAKMEKNASEDDDLPVKPVRRNARAQVRGADPGPDVTNLLKLNSLIDEIGGFDAYKGLLLSAVEAVESFQMEHNRERDSLVTQIVANSAGEFEKADLEDLSIPVLKKMANAFGGHDVSVDYSLLNPKPLKANKEDVAPLPNIGALFQNQKED